MTSYCQHNGRRTLHFDSFHRPNERCEECGHLWPLRPYEDEAEEYGNRSTLGPRDEFEGIARLAIKNATLEKRIENVEQNLAINFSFLHAKGTRKNRR